MPDPVTMAQIDAARERVGWALEMKRSGSAPGCGLGHATIEDCLAFERSKVEELLRRWWAQGCREVPHAS